MAPTEPSAAAAAGAAAAALLQKQLAADGAAGPDATLESGWSEHQTGDGRKFYFHEDTQTCSWEKPEVLMTPEERANDTMWREYKIWDGRAFYHNRETKVSCWSMPPELRKLRGESAGVDDKPLPQTNAQKRRAFWELLKEKGVDETWTWQGVSEATAGEPAALEVSEAMRKQCFAELLGLSMRQRQMDSRKRDRDAANALERLIEDTFSQPEDLATTYEQAAQRLSGTEAWNLIKSEVRRDEVFQTVMERLEEKHKKARVEGRPGRVLRLQRLLASDADLRRTRLRWQDSMQLLARKDEMREEKPPLEALRVWASLRELKQASEHEAEAKAKVTTPEATAAYREERRRRDALVALVRELAIKGRISVASSWTDFETLARSDPRLIALQEGPGATAMELFEEFQEELRAKGPEAFLGCVPGEAPVEEEAAEVKLEGAPAQKRQRTAAAEEEAVSALDALIAGESIPQKQEPAEEEEEEDPLMAVVTKAAAEKERLAAAEQAAAATSATARGLSEAELQAKKLEELRSMCRDRGLPVSGRKQDLVDRLTAA